MFFKKDQHIAYYRIGAGVEIDFIIETARPRPDRSLRVVATEIKRAERWDRVWEKPMRSSLNYRVLKSTA
jgi:hypothetical protein